jgi:hypothetical protein
MRRAVPQSRRARLLAMYKLPIITAAFVFLSATLVEVVAVEILRGSVTGWLVGPYKLLFVALMILINAVQGALLGYAAHRAAANALLLRRAEQDRSQLSARLGEELRPALSMVQYAAYHTANKRCIEICNAAIARILNVVPGATASTR